MFLDPIQEKLNQLAQHDADSSFEKTSIPIVRRRISKRKSNSSKIDKTQSVSKKTAIQLSLFN